jgi:hypothetical protein
MTNPTARVIWVCFSLAWAGFWALAGVLVLPLCILFWPLALASAGAAMLPVGASRPVEGPPRFYAPRRYNP